MTLVRLQCRFDLHQLKGDLEGLWSVSVNKNWRILFRFEDGSAIDVDFVDYQVNEKAGVSPEMAVRLSKAFGSDPDTWLRMQVAYDLAQLNHAAIRVQRYRKAW